MSNPLEPALPNSGGLRSLNPEVMSPAERLEEAASLLARGILRRRLGTADLSTVALAKVDGRKPALSPPAGGSKGKVLMFSPNREKWGHL